MITATVIMVRAWCSVRRGPFEEAHQSGAAAARTVLRRAGDGWSESAGGTSGALWGSALTAVRAVLSDQHGADDGEIVQTVRAGAGAVVRLGDAQLGDKAMVDALIHFADTLRSSFAPGNPLAQVWLQTAGATTEAAAQTAQITAGLGRAKTHGDCHADPGATSFRPADEPQQRRLRGRRSLPLPLVAQRRAFDSGSAASGQRS
jgi:dihydroxyacetone kinase